MIALTVRRLYWRAVWGFCKSSMLTSSVAESYATARMSAVTGGIWADASPNLVACCLET